ncbi:MAG: family 20 glycosylhydrolase [Prevotella sp.]|nr:family 20 glycosylhydrolase [Prevotella sp.]
MKRYLMCIILCMGMGCAAVAQNIIPQPVSVVMGKGLAGKDARVETMIDNTFLQKDGYQIVISKNIKIKAQNEAGLQYARETLSQLRTQYGDALPRMTITDYPRFEWRGLMLDCARHFYTLEYLKKQVDILAHYKMNRLHLHLTDDQGWRIEIKRYPELTQQGAWREFNRHDSICLERYKDKPEFALDSRFIIRHGDKTLYGGYYTQEQLRELVRYAADRHVEIIPEIDMPGHTQAISLLHHEFTATGEAKWGKVFSYPLSPAKEEVYEYLQNILDEVLDIFPSHYIHIGADEVEKDTWKQSDACKALMQREGIETYEALQSYFVHRIQRYLESKGREIICWDDAMEGGLDSKADVMYWRTWIAGVLDNAMKGGHHVIFTPGSPMYIGHSGRPMYEIYHYNGYDVFPEEHKHLIRGGQVSLWAEGMSSYRLADNCIYPRMLALAERLWTPKEQADWKSFKKRLEQEKKWLAAHDVVCGKTSSTLNLMQTTNLDKRQLEVTFDSDFDDADIRYTLDGSTPTGTSLAYTDEPICVKHGDPAVDLVAAVMIDGVPQEPLSRRHLEYHKAVGARVDYLSGRWYETYKADELATFTDGKRGVETGYGDGLWQGFQGDFEVAVDLGSVQDINAVSMRFIQNIGPDVYMPGKVEMALSVDGQNYGEATAVLNDVPTDKTGVIIKDFTNTYSQTRARYIKVKVFNTQKAFVFSDEIVVR